MNLITLTANSCPEHKSLLNALIQQSFGFSLEDWERRGLWTEDYACTSLMDAGGMASNVGMYRMDLLLGGTHKEAYQIGAVVTRADKRGRGLSRLLMEYIISQRPGATYFLSANESVLDFYPRFGFRPVQEHQAFLSIPSGAVAPDQCEEKAVHMAASDPHVEALLSRRGSYSQVLDCTSADPVRWFNILASYSDSLYVIPNLELLLVAQQQGSVLSLIDIASAHPVSLNQILPFLPFQGYTTVSFGFNPDWLGVNPEYREYSDGHLFVRGEWNVDEPFLLPWLIRT